MKLYKFNDRICSFDLWHWAFPIAIEIGRYYPVHFDAKENEILGNKLSSVSFELSILCFHIEIWLKTENDT